MENPHDTPDAPQPGWELSLPRDAFYEIIRVLRGALPPPDTDAPEDWERRDRAAMAAVSALLPANAAEGRLAALFVQAEAWAADCLRLAVERRRELEVAHKCRAQALSLMREAKSAWRLLKKAQAERREMETDEAASDRAAWVEHCAVEMMRAGLEPVAAAAAPLTPARSRQSGRSGGVRVQMRSPSCHEGPDALTGSTWKIGSGSDRATHAPGMRSETEPRLRPPLVRSAA